MKKSLRVLGHLIVAASIVFLVVAITDQFDSIGDQLFDLDLILILAVASALQAVLLFGLAAAWALMLTPAASWPQLQPLIGIYARTSILKYLPGNMFHFVGRNVVGKDDSRRHSEIAAATIFEILLSALSVVLLVSAIFAVYGGWFPPWAGLLAAAGALAGFAILFLAPRLFPVSWKSRFLRRFVPMIEQTGRLVPNLWQASGLVLASFALMIAACALVAATLLPASAIPLQIAGYSVMAWLFGFVVPGAPGGIGVREAVLVMLIAPAVGEPSAVVLAVVLRLATVLGDGLLFLTGLVLFRR